MRIATEYGGGIADCRIVTCPMKTVPEEVPPVLPNPKRRCAALGGLWNEETKRRVISTMSVADVIVLTSIIRNREPPTRFARYQEE